MKVKRAKPELIEPEPKKLTRLFMLISAAVVIIAIAALLIVMWPSKSWDTAGTTDFSTIPQQANQYTTITGCLDYKCEGIPETDRPQFCKFSICDARNNCTSDFIFDTDVLDQYNALSTYYRDSLNKCVKISITGNVTEYSSCINCPEKYILNYPKKYILKVTEVKVL